MKIVVPVRFAAHDRMAQTTSREITETSVLVACGRRPRAKELVALRLYLPDSHPPASTVARVRDEAGTGEFWLDIIERIFGVGERIEALVSR